MKIRNLRWIVPTAVVIVVLAVLTVYLTAPGPVAAWIRTRRPLRAPARW